MIDGETCMAQDIDYYVSLNSPWTHMGAARIEVLAAKYDATLRVYPVDFGTVFATSGGLQLLKRSPQRHAHRLQELRCGRPAQVQGERLCRTNCGSVH
jgi:2-hydroxychromene-2-carboxylate isomerase